MATSSLRPAGASSQSATCHPKNRDPKFKVLAKLDPDRNWRRIDRGQSGILAAYAALFEPSIKEVVIIDPPKSHMEGPHFLGVLRVLDIPEALGLLAPNVKLTLINARDPAFDRTEAIYRTAGASKMLIRNSGAGLGSCVVTQ